MIQNKRFTIGFLGVPVKRKNLELIIKAIDKLSLNITLKLHISHYYDWLQPINFPNDEKFDVSYGYKDNDALNEWYSSLDAYIFPSSGEGWSFTPRESLSLEIPTIISNCLVHQELEDYCESIKLPITKDKISRSIINVYKKCR